MASYHAIAGDLTKTKRRVRDTWDSLPDTDRRAIATLTKHYAASINDQIGEGLDED